MSNSVMRTPRIYTIGLSAVLALLGTLTSYLITDKVAGSAAAIRAVHVGLIWTIIGTLTLLLAWLYSGRRAIWYQLYDGFLIFFGANSLLLAIAFPLFLTYGLTSSVGTGLAIYAIALFSYQSWRAHRNFQDRWLLNKDRAFAKALNKESKQMNTDVFVHFLNLEVELLLPWKLSRFGFLILGLMLISMVTGLNLRKVFPLFSIFAYGIPALTFLSVSTQIVLFRVLIAFKLIGIEREIGAVLAPTERTPASRTKDRSRRRR